ncbi:hypothetical protein ACFVHW_38165, partial [Streptomyces sp. NPDC127110]
MNLNAQKVSQRPRTRSRLLLASLTAAAALSGQLVATAPAAFADGPKPSVQDQQRNPDKGKDDHKKKPVQFPHGLRQFTSDNTFTVPAGVTTVFVQAWGAGGGGGGGGGASRTNPGGAGGGGGAGGFTWCALNVRPLADYGVDIGTGGAGGPGGPGGATTGTAGTAGTAGSATTVVATTTNTTLATAPRAR